jgi:large subunit ribosomal protein L23Ae
MKPAQTKAPAEGEKAKYARAQKFSKLIKKGRNNTVKFRAFRSTPKFRRLQRSLRTLPRTPKYSRRSVVRQNTWDRFSILKAPCTSERFYKKMETENTIIFFVDAKANKTEIKQAFQEAFNVRPERVNTLTTLGGKKKAYIKIPKTNEASEIANKIGLI